MSMSPPGMRITLPPGATLTPVGAYTVPRCYCAWTICQIRPAPPSWERSGLGGVVQPWLSASSPWGRSPGCTAHQLHHLSDTPGKHGLFLPKLNDHKGLLCVAPETLIENVAYVHSYTRMQTHKHTVNTCFWMTKKIFPFPHPVVAPYFFFSLQILSLPRDASSFFPFLYSSSLRVKRGQVTCLLNNHSEEVFWYTCTQKTKTQRDIFNWKHFVVHVLLFIILLGF